MPKSKPTTDALTTALLLTNQHIDELRREIAEKERQIESLTRVHDNIAAHLEAAGAGEARTAGGAAGGRGAPATKGRRKGADPVEASRSSLTPR